MYGRTTINCGVVWAGFLVHSNSSCFYGYLVGLNLDFCIVDRIVAFAN